MNTHSDEHTEHRGRRLRTRRLFPRSENGQVFALMAISILALIGLSGFVVDVGVAYRAHRRAQTTADASALGAAQLLPGDTSLATATANGLRAQNLSEGSIDTPTYSSTYTSNDTVTVTARTTSAGVFTKALDASFDTFNEKATAKATVGSYTGWSTNIAPWAIPQQNLVWAQTVQFKTDKAGQGNFGVTDLPMIETGCSLSSGGSDYKGLVDNDDHSCLVQIGDQLQAEPGNKAGPTLQGLDARVVNGEHVYGKQPGNPPFCPTPDSCPILDKQSDGSYVLTTYNHANLVVIPVVDQVSNGASYYTVVGFAWFIIQKYTNKTVDGMFISSEAPGAAKCPTASDPNAPCPIGAYNQLGFKVIQLTG